MSMKPSCEGLVILGAMGSKCAFLSIAISLFHKQEHEPIQISAIERQVSAASRLLATHCRHAMRAGSVTYAWLGLPKTSIACTPFKQHAH